MPDSHNVIIVSGPWVGSLTQNEFFSSVFGKTRYDGRAESRDCYQQTILSSHDGDGSRFCRKWNIENSNITHICIFI